MFMFIGSDSVYFNYRNTPTHTRLKQVSQHLNFDVSLSPPQHCEAVPSLSVGGKRDDRGECACANMCWGEGK